jgi:hypothetical protein
MAETVVPIQAMSGDLFAIGRAKMANADVKAAATVVMT